MIFFVLFPKNSRLKDKYSKQTICFSASKIQINGFNKNLCWQKTNIIKYVDLFQNHYYFISGNFCIKDKWKNSVLINQIEKYIDLTKFYINEKKSF